MAIIEDLDDEDDGDAGEPLSEEQQREQERRRQRIEEAEREEAERVARQFALGEEHRLEGNRLFKEGAFDGALREYDRAMHELTLVGNLPGDRTRAEKANLVLHLNLALTNLKRGGSEALGQAAHQASMALTIDPLNVKGLYRRGLAQAAQARAASLFQEAKARAAIEDFDKALKVEPTNSEVHQELQRLRTELRAHEKDLADKQKMTWTRVFGGRTVTDDDEPARPEEPLAPVRACKNRGQHDGYHLIASAEGASVLNRDGSPAIRDVDLEFREKWCIGFYGDAAGRAALGKLVARTVTPSSGRVVVHPKKPQPGHKKREEDLQAALATMRPMAVGAAVLILALVAATERTERNPLRVWAVRCFAGAFLAMIGWFLQYDGKPKLPLKTTLVTSDPAAIEAISPKSTVEAVIGSQLARQIPARERRAKVVALLCAAGARLRGGDADEDEARGAPAQCVEDGLLYGELSAQQKHVVFVLRCIASRPEVLVCDDPLRGLPEACQARLLQMFKRMKRECFSSIVYLSEDLDQLSLIAESLGMLAGGAICEKGPTEEVLETPRRPETEAYIAEYKKKAGCKTIGASLRARCSDLVGDAALAGPWLPPWYL